MKFLFIFSFSLLLLFILWDILTKKYLNPYKLYVLFGKKGVGKSTLLQKLARYYRKKGYHVYCNLGDSLSKDITPIPIQDLPRLAESGHQIYHYKNFDLAKEIEKEYKDKGIDSPPGIKQPAVILCDEINLLWDNRNFKNFSPDLQRYFRLQRHYKHIFIGFSQTYDCDKKIRDLADELVIVKKSARIWIHCKSYVKKVVVVSPEKGNSRDTAMMTDDFIPRGLISDLFSPFNAWLPKWVKLHDSFK